MMTNQQQAIVCPSSDYKMKYAPADFKIRNAQLSSPKDKPRYVAHGF